VKAVLVLLAAAVLVPVALAANGQPQKKITKAGQARARVASVHMADVGAGWTSKPATKQNQADPRCANYRPDQSDLTEIGHYDSPDFSRPDGTFVSSTTGVFKSVAQAKTAFKRVAQPTFGSCFGQLLTKQLGTQGKLTISAAGPIPFPRTGEITSAWGIRALYSLGNQKAPFAVDLVLVNKGATDIGLIFFGVGKPLPAAFEQQVAAKVAARAK
jgi:hypothetical protein